MFNCNVNDCSCLKGSVSMLFTCYLETSMVCSCASERDIKGFEEVEEESAVQTMSGQLYKLCLGNSISLSNNE